MKFGKKLYYNFCSVLPTKMLKKMAPDSTLLPYHHLVSDEDVRHVKHLYTYKNTQQFRKDLDHLLKHFRPVDVQDIVKAVAGNKLPSDSFLLTFDDGFREVHDVIAPILTKKGVPAIFFVNPAFLDNSQLFYRCKISLVVDEMLMQKNDEVLIRDCMSIMGMKSNDLAVLIAAVKKINNLNQQLLDALAARLQLSFEDYLKNKRPFLTTDQCRNLVSSGFTIGAHSWDHPYYDLISADEQKEQTLKSCSFVKENFGQGFNFFSFPHSDKPLSQAFFEKIATGSPKIDLFFGIQNQKRELGNKMLHRFNAERRDLMMNKQMNGILMLMIAQKLLNKGTVTRDAGMLSTK